jgi:hypothetical protein
MDFELSERHPYTTSNTSLNLNLSPHTVPGEVVEVPRYIHIRTLVLIMMLPIVLLIFVVLPIIIDAPYYSYPWLNSGDVWKIVDPLFTLPVYYFILENAMMYHNPRDTVKLLRKMPRFLWISRRTLLKLIFVIAMGVYVEGHGLHTAATIFKDPVKVAAQNLQQSQGTPTTPPLEEIYSYIRDKWQHVYSHYIYAAGAFVMSLIHMVAHVEQVHAELNTRWEWAIFITASILYGLLFAATSINFPGGLTVGFILIALVAVPFSIYLYRSIDESIEKISRVYFGRHRFLFSKGKKLVVQFYLLSYLVSLIVMIIWIIVNGYKDGTLIVK